MDDTAWLCDPDGVGPRLSLLKVPEPKATKEPAVPMWARIKTEAERLVKMGGSVRRESDGHHVVMAVLEGNEFCVPRHRPED